MTPVITAKQLRKVMGYDPETGAITWLINASTKARVGTIAGCFDHEGYRVIGYGGRLHKAHRLAWLHVYGVWPDREVDHINGDRADNRIANLRLATNNENKWNAKVQKNSRTGVKGVRWSPKGRNWRATIRVRYQRIHLGCFEKIEDAAAAYKAASQKYHGEFGRAE